MPRKSIIVPGFVGGINNAIDPRYINDTELVDAVNVKISTDGLIQPLGEFITDVSTGNSLSSDPWYGFAAFGVDRSLVSPYSPGRYQIFIEAGEDVGSGDQRAYVYDSSGTLRYTIILDATGNTVKGIFGRNNDGYVIENAELTVNSTTRIFFFVDRTVFKNYKTVAGSPNPSYTQQGWFDKEYWPQDKKVYFLDGYRGYIATDEDPLSTSSSTLFYVDTSSSSLYSAHKSIIEGANADGYPFALYSSKNKLLARITQYDYAANTITTDSISTYNWDSDYTCYITPPPGKGLSVIVEEAATTATVNLPSNYKVGFSYLYGRNREEGPITEGTTTFNSPASGNLFRITAILSGFDEDQTGLRLYIRDVDRPGDWRLVMEIDAVDGYKHDLFDITYNEYEPKDISNGLYGVSNYKIVLAQRDITELPADTYQAINGVYPHELVGLRFKSFASYGGYYYYGNVSVDGDFQPDAVYRSRPNKSRIVSKLDRFEIIPNDGDEIMQLAAYGERLFVFKRRKTIVVNVGAQEPFIELIKDQAGIPSHACVAQTDYGIVWASDTGCYIFDGDRITDLLMDPSSPLRRRIDLDWWNTYISSTTGIAYNPITNELFIHKSYTSNNDMLVFNFKTMTWTRGYGKLFAYSNMSSPGVTLSGSLVYKPGNDIIKWSGDPVSDISSTEFGFKTKQFFGATTEYQKVLNMIRVTSKRCTTDLLSIRLKPYIAVDDGGDELMSGSLGKQTYFTSDQLLPPGGPSSYRRDFRWVQFVVKVDTSTTSSVPKDFAFKGLELIYRDKGYRNE